MPKKDTVQAISKIVGDDLTEAQIEAVLNARDHVTEGDPIGMVLRDEATGKVAHRVDVNGVQQWRVSGPDGELYNDLQPTLDWTVIYDVG